MFDTQILTVLRSIDSRLATLNGKIDGIASALSEHLPTLLALVAFGVLLYGLSWFIRKGGRI